MNDVTCLDLRNIVRGKVPLTNSASSSAAKWNARGIWEYPASWTVDDDLILGLWCNLLGHLRPPLVWVEGACWLDSMVTEVCVKAVGSWVRPRIPQVENVVRYAQEHRMDLALWSSGGAIDLRSWL